MLTSNELLVLNDGHVGLQAGEAEELSPGDADLVDVGTLPVVEATPWRQNQNPIPSILPQGLHQGGHADVDISAQIKTLRRVHVIEKVPGEKEKTAGSFINACFFSRLTFSGQNFCYWGTPLPPLTVSWAIRRELTTRLWNRGKRLFLFLLALFSQQ